MPTIRDNAVASLCQVLCFSSATYLQLASREVRGNIAEKVTIDRIPDSKFNKCLETATVPTFDSCTKFAGQPRHTILPHARLPPSFLGMDARMTSKLNLALIHKLRGSLINLAYFFDMLAIGVCTTRHWQASGRLVQELNVCTVALRGNTKDYYWDIPNRLTILDWQLYFTFSSYLFAATIYLIKVAIMA